MRQTVVGVFDRHAAARQAAQELRDSGFGDSVFLTDDLDAGDGAVRGVDVGAFAQVRSFFADLFDSDERVRPYAEAVRRGGAVVKVEVDDDRDVDAARSALIAAGAVDIEERIDDDDGDGAPFGAAGWPRADARDDALRSGAAATTAGLDRDVDAVAARLDAGAGAGAGTDADASTDTRADAADAGTDAPFRTGTTTDLDASEAAAAPGRVAGSTDAEVIPVVKEELQLGTRVVGTGGVRVYARTVETPVRESVTLRSERAEVTRRAVDRPATEADLAHGERTIEVRETTEEPVVEKQSRVVEEVVVVRTTQTRTEEIRDTLRSTEVEVEPLDAGRDTAARGAAREETGFASGGAADDWEPAYRYGHAMRDDPRYAGRRWNEAEPQLRGDWETRHPGGSWERLKDAVRRGWDRMTS